MPKIPQTALFALLLALASSCGTGEGEAGAKPAAPALPPPPPAAALPSALEERAAAKPPFKPSPYLNARTGLMFPAWLDGLPLRGPHDYGKPALGISVKYAQEDGALPALDIYVYGDQQQDMKDGCEAPAVQKSFNSALQEISKLEAKGAYSNVKFLYRGKMELLCADGSKLSALAAKISLNSEKKGKLRSYVLILAYKEAFLKLRLSEQDKPGEEAAPDARFDRIVKALGLLLNKGNATSVDPDVKDSVLNAVKALEDDPLSGGMVALPAIVAFTRDSEDVTVTLSPEVLPWLKSPEKPRHSELLLGAFMGGNVRSQLMRNVREDSPIEGLRCVFAVYRKIQLSEPSFKSPGIERLMKLDAEGSLEKEIAPRKGQAKPER